MVLGLLCRQFGLEVVRRRLEHGRGAHQEQRLPTQTQAHTSSEARPMSWKVLMSIAHSGGQIRRYSRRPWDRAPTEGIATAASNHSTAQRCTAVKENQFVVSAATSASVQKARKTLLIFAACTAFEYYTLVRSLAELQTRCER